MSAFEFIGLDEATGKLRAPLVSDTYIANRAVHLTQALTTDSTIDGRDIAVDGANLDTALQPGANISVLTNDSGYADDQTDAEIATAYQNEAPLVSQVVAEAGVDTSILSWSALRVKQAAVAAQASGIYGIMSCQIGVTGEALVDVTPRKITAWNTDGMNNGVTPVNGSDHILIDTAGIYQVCVSVAFSGTSSKQYQLEIYKNGLTTGFAVDRKLGTSGDVGSCSIVGIITCAQSDTIEVYQSSSDGGSAITVSEAQLAVHRISS